MFATNSSFGNNFFVSVITNKGKVAYIQPLYLTLG